MSEMAWSEIKDLKERVKLLEQKVASLAVVLDLVSSRPDVDVPAALEITLKQKQEGR